MFDDAPLLLEVPDWLLTAPEPASLWDPPCGCCAEPDPSPDPVAGWAVPGVTWGEPAAVARPAPSAAVAALQLAAQRVCAVDPGSLSPEQALVDGEVLMQVGQRLRVHDVRRLEDVRRRELFALAGHRSTVSWLRELQPDADASLAGLAGRLAVFGRLNASVQAGDCSLGASKRVAQALARCRPHVDRADGLIDEQPAEQVVTAVVRHVPGLVAGCLLGMSGDDPRFCELVGAAERIVLSPTGELDRLEAAFTLLAEHVPVSMLAGCLEDLVLAVLPSLLEDRDLRGRDRAGLSLRPRPDGSGWQLEAELDLECGERLFTALSAEARRDQDNPADTAAAARLRDQGVDPFDPEAAVAPWEGWPRSTRRRLHDALDRLLGRYLEAGLGGSAHKAPVQVTVTITADRLEARPGALPGSGDSGQRLPTSLLRRWWCDSDVTAYLLTRGGKALRVVHAGRTLTGRQRRAALLEHRGRCAGVGCCRGGPAPGADLRPHHVRRWTEDGRTSLDETVLVCDVLHRDLHEGRRTIRLRDGRQLSEQGWIEPATVRS